MRFFPSCLPCLILRGLLPMAFVLLLHPFGIHECAFSEIGFFVFRFLVPLFFLISVVYAAVCRFPLYFLSSGGWFVLRWLVFGGAKRVRIKKPLPRRVDLSFYRFSSAVSDFLYNPGISFPFFWLLAWVSLGCGFPALGVIPSRLPLPSMRGGAQVVPPLVLFERRP